MAGLLLVAATQLHAPASRTEAAGASDTAANEVAAPNLSSPVQAPTILAAGDIASCDSQGDERTAAIISAHPEATILGLGDFAYPDGSDADFADCFDASWGAYKSRIRPVPGNHDYYAAGAEPYFRYFGAAAGPSSKPSSRGYYSFDLGTWHIVALNSEQDLAPNGKQLAWLKSDLAANTQQCVLAFWHRPRFTSSDEHSDTPEVGTFWDVLYAAGVDVVLNGHDHIYERYAPMNPSAQLDPLGIREFVVGTGGRAAHDLRPDARREAAQSGKDFVGLLQLTLLDSGYEWNFEADDGLNYSDSGSGQCH